MSCGKIGFFFILLVAQVYCQNWIDEFESEDDSVSSSINLPVIVENLLCNPHILFFSFWKTSS